MGLVNGCLYVLWRWGPHRGTIGDQQYADSEKCKRGRVKRPSVFSSALKFKHWSPIHSIFISTWTHSDWWRNIYSLLGSVSCPCPYVGGSGPVPEAPGAPCIWFWLLRYNEGAGAWLLRGRVAALQPWPCSNPGKPIPSSLLPHSALGCRRIPHGCIRSDR